MKIIVLLEKCLPLFFWVLMMFGFDSPAGAVLTITVAVLHELGHMLMISLFTNKRASFPIANITGFRIRINELSYKEELLVSLGGPLINLIFGLPFAFIPASSVLLSYLKAFGIINLVTMVSNLFPIESFDGYRIISSVFGILGRADTSFSYILDTLSLAFTSLTCFLSLYLILKLGEGYWIFLIFFSLLISTIIKKQNRTIWENK